MELATLDQLIHLLNLPAQTCMKNKSFKGFSVDTRTIKPDEVYVALQGERVDGHSFLDEAYAKGAAAALVSKQYQGPHTQHTQLPLIQVEEPLHALQELAKKVIERRQTRVVAVTGSLGKTTTKEFINSLLRVKHRVAVSPGNSNSQVGLPLTILNHTTGDEEVLILEMGMTHPGHLTRLVQIAPPEVALITKVALVHACHFNAIEEIGWAKAEIFSHPKTRLGILDREINNFHDLCRIGSCHKLSFSSTCSEADYYVDIQTNSVHASLEGHKILLEPLKLPGRHNWHNFLAASVVARHFNVSWEEIKLAMDDLELPPKRLQLIEHNGVLFLNDSYNAAEPSLMAALDTLPRPVKEGKKIAVLGSMMELGKFSEDCHRRVGQFALTCVDRLYCLGAECQPIYEVWKSAGRPIELFENRADLVAALRKALKPDDVVLLKGSRSKELWKVLEELEE